MKYVVFVCTHNAGRSQMAQALFERFAPSDLRAESAGSDPAHRVWPGVVEVMREIDIDISRNKPRRLTVEMQLHADWAITMGCGDVCPYVPTTVYDWDLPDPAGLPIDEIRDLRDEIERRVRELTTDRIGEIRSDAGAHRWRLQKLLPELIAEFGDVREPELIRGCADRVLDDYDDVPIRSHILTLAHKRTRKCLREERCALL